METELIRWFAALSTMAAATMVAWRGTARLTGWGFVLFCAASLGWIGAAVIDGAPALAAQNVVLLAINLFGVWRWFART